MALFLCGDVMTGRGVDQIQRHPANPALLESYVRDARTYVRLAEETHGSVPRPVDASWVWGDVLDLIAEAAPDVRLVNLETALTRCGQFAVGKAVHYRMNPENVEVLATVEPVCVLANNHALDFGRPGLLETLDTLAGTGITMAGAGADIDQAQRPAVVDLGDRGRLMVFGFGATSSGIPPHWAATRDQPGVDLLPDLSPSASDDIAARIRRARRPGDLVVASIHWGSNWGYDVPVSHTQFAHHLIDAGVDIVHGHSSHHPRPIEVYRGKLILYGCGDLIDDYEGISGHEEFRPHLRLAYLAWLRPGSGLLEELRIWPLRVRQLRLRHAASQDRDWLIRTLDRICRPFGTGVAAGPDGAFTLRSS